MPKHICYVEPFCGAAWVFFKKPESKSEVLNDLDNNIINVYRVIQRHPEEFLKQINRAFRDRGMDPARDQRGCSTPFWKPRQFCARSKLREILDSINCCLDGSLWTCNKPDPTPPALFSIISQKVFACNTQLFAFAMEETSEARFTD
jgi:D12 class N6 adenine-specific DNA methyltransferase